MSVDNFTNIDFDGLKLAFVDFLKGHPQFKDYHFDGSNISVFLDVLALNSYKNQFYLNMALSEMFIDTAQLRDSLVSHAKELSYLPRSAKSAVGYINIEIVPTDAPEAIILNKGTPFGARIDNSVYPFTTNQTFTILPVDGRYSLNNIPVYEGKYVSETFVRDTSSSQRFVLSNKNIDISSLVVKVYPSTTSNVGEEYFFASSFLGMDANSKAYFVQAAEKEKYEIFFGDGVIGKKLDNLNLIEVQYRICSGGIANKATNFSALSTIGGYSNITVNTVSAAAGGAEIEDIESIRYNAPRYFQTQGRAVNTTDYETLLRIQFPEIQSISVFGGEDMDPPQYGKVIISVDLSDADGVPNIKKTAIEDYIRQKCATVIPPKVIDPEFLYIEVISNVEYDVGKTTLSAVDIKTKVLRELASFGDKNLNDFNVKFLASKMIAVIDNADTSILGNSTKIRAVAYLTPAAGDVISHVNINYQNELEQDTFDNVSPSLYSPAISSSTFSYGGQSCILEDNGLGTIQIVYKNGADRTALFSAGIVDYASGKISLNGFSVTGYTGEAIKIYARLKEPEITVARNTILSLDFSNVNVNVVPG